MQKVERRSFLASLWASFCAGMSIVLWGREAALPRQLKYPTVDTEFIPANIAPIFEAVYTEGFGDDLMYCGQQVEARILDDVKIGDALYWDHERHGLAKLNTPAQPGHCVALEPAKKYHLARARIIG